MPTTLEARLRTLAEQELDRLSHEPLAPRELMEELQRLEVHAQALFLIQDRDIAEVHQILSAHALSWLAFIRSNEPMALWSGSSRPQASEYLMVICDLLVNGLLESLAANDMRATLEFRALFLGRGQPEIELSDATMLLARHLCLLSDREFERASDELDNSWDEWTEFGLVHPQDHLWTGLRGIAKNDARLVLAALHGLSHQRVVALRYAVESGLVLRSTLPARLTLQTSSGALVRLARSRGIECSLDTEDLLTRRAARLWRLE